MSYHIITPDPYEGNANRHTAVGLPPTGHEQRGIGNGVITMWLAAIVLAGFLLLFHYLPNGNTSPQIMETSKAMKSRPVPKTSPVPGAKPAQRVKNLNELRVISSGCESEELMPGYTDGGCSVVAYVLKNGHYVSKNDHYLGMYLNCGQRWATCMPLTRNEDYYYEIVHGLPECRGNASISKHFHITEPCVEIYARPYNAVYTDITDAVTQYEQQER